MATKLLRRSMRVTILTFFSLFSSFLSSGGDMVIYVDKLDPS